jgi:predicted nucleic acid-binding protein
MRIFLDANVLFSAAYNTSNGLRGFFSLADVGVSELISSAFALDEARCNIARKHSAQTPELEQLITRITVCREAAPDAVRWAHATGLPDKDAPILAAAVQAKANMLVTCDRAHFGMLYECKVGGVEVLTPRAALERILALANQ